MSLSESSLHTIRFQLYDILGEAKLERLKNISDCCVKEGGQIKLNILIYKGYDLCPTSEQGDKTILVLLPSVPQ